MSVTPPVSTKKESYFLNKVIGIEGGGVRNFIFFGNRHAGDKQLWLSAKRQFKLRLILGIWVFFVIAI